jgi:hypothetical protein
VFLEELCVLRYVYFLFLLQCPIITFVNRKLNCPHFMCVHQSASLCAPFVTRHTSIRQPNSFHTRCVISGVTVSTAQQSLFQQDGIAPRGRSASVLLRRWTGHAVGEDAHLLRWPPQSPDIISYDLFLWGLVKEMVYIPPLPQSLLDLRN